MSGVLHGAAAFRSGAISATAAVAETLDRISRLDAGLGCFTRLFARQALDEAQVQDRARAQGRRLGPLAGVAFAVKDLFDLAGVTTTAGAASRLDAPPAARDADAVARMRAAGAILVGTLNMDEFAYGFVTRNAHFGTTRNPRDQARLAGGSSGGSAAAVAAGMLPVTLGSDTNGSIRIPAALCGVYGLRPGRGAVSVRGCFPLAPSLDTVGYFAATAQDFPLLFGTLKDDGASNPVMETPRVATLGGWFARNVTPDLQVAIGRIGERLGARGTIELPEVERARSAAFLITAAEAGNLHLPALRTRAGAFDPETRDRFLAGALIPAAAILQAQRFRRWFIARTFEAMGDHDILLAPAAPGVAPRIDDPVIQVGGRSVSARVQLGLFTQPVSLLGFPVLTVPVAAASGLSMGVQLIAKPGGEALLFRAAQALEEDGLVGMAPVQDRDVHTAFA